MVIKMFMPVAQTDKIDILKVYARRKHPKKRVEVVSLYRGMHPAILTRQNMVHIANSAPKFITQHDTVYLMVIPNAILMGMLCSRITDRMNRLFTRSKRRWYLLEYSSKTKSFDEYFLP